MSLYNVKGKYARIIQPKHRVNIPKSRSRFHKEKRKCSTPSLTTTTKAMKYVKRDDLQWENVEHNSPNSDQLDHHIHDDHPEHQKLLSDNRETVATLLSEFNNRDSQKSDSKSNERLTRLRQIPSFTRHRKSQYDISTEERHKVDPTVDKLEVSLMQTEIDGRTLQEEVGEFFELVVDTFQAGKWVDSSDIRSIKSKKLSTMHAITKFCGNIGALRRELIIRRDEKRFESGLVKQRESLSHRMTDLEDHCEKFREMLIKKEEELIQVQKDLAIEKSHNEQFEAHINDVAKLKEHLVLKEQDCLRLTQSLATMEHHLCYERSKCERMSQLLNETRDRMEKDQHELLLLKQSLPLENSDKKNLNERLFQQSAELANLRDDLRKTKLMLQVEKEKNMADNRKHTVKTIHSVDHTDSKRDQVDNSKVKKSTEQLDVKSTENTEVLLQRIESLEAMVDSLQQNSNRPLHSNSVREVSTTPRVKPPCPSESPNEVLLRNENKRLLDRITSLNCRLTQANQTKEQADSGLKSEIQKLQYQVEELTRNNQSLQTYIQQIRTSYTQVFGDGNLVS